MIVVGSVIVLAIFLAVGWAIATEMFQQRAWRRRAEEGDPDMVRALLDEAFTTWQRARPPRGLSAHLWAGVQGAQIVATTAHSAQVSSSAEGEFRSEDGRRVQISTALDEGMALAARLVDMLLYDVPNLRLASVRVDIYSTFTGSDGTPVQQPILSTNATRADAEDIAWEAMSPAEVLGRFDTRYERGPTGQALPLSLEPFRPAEAV